MIDEGTGKVVLTKQVRQEKTPLGDYAVMDFSELQTPGKYVLRAGDDTTRSFEIGPEAWRESIWKAINFMYSERCGTVIPGIHAICHTDDYSVHGDRRIIVNGGYHDAGDLSATGNTPGMAYALFSLAERLGQQDEDPQLRARLIEEGTWGLRWVLKTNFGGGFRTTGQLISYWTNGIMGDADDRFGQAVNNPEWNFRVAAVEALAARVLKESDPELAIRSLKTAELDWNYAVEGLKTAPPLSEVYGAQDELERISFGAIASIDLYRATGEQKYADEAFRLGELILASQEQKLQPWNMPMTGYFYTSPKRENLFHRFHIGQEEEPIVALAHLCETFPNDANWMKWYSGIVLHSKYYQQVAAKVDEPYGVLPAAVYKESEARLIPQAKDWTPLRAADRDAYVEEVRRGVPSGRGILSAAIPGVVRLPGKFQRFAFGGEGALDGRAVAWRPGSGGSGAKAGGVAAGPQSVFREHHVRGGLRLDSVVQRALGAVGGRASCWNRNEGIQRRALLADADLLDVQRGLDATGGRVDLADAGSARRSGGGGNCGRKSTGRVSRRKERSGNKGGCKLRGR